MKTKNKIFPKLTGGLDKKRVFLFRIIVVEPPSLSPSLVCSSGQPGIKQGKTEIFRFFGRCDKVQGDILTVSSTWLKINSQYLHVMIVYQMALINVSCYVRF